MKPQTEGDPQGRTYQGSSARAAGPTVTPGSGLDAGPRDQSSEIVNPATGEVLNLDAPTTDLARYLADMRDIEARWRDIKSVVTGELLRRMDATASWTLHLDGLTVKGASPQPVEEYDAAALRDALLELVDDGTLDIAAVDRALALVVSVKPHAAGIKALRKLGGKVAETVDAHARTVERRRYISVTGK